MVDKDQDIRSSSNVDKKDENRESKIKKIKHPNPRDKHNREQKKTPSSSELSSLFSSSDRSKSRSPNRSRRRHISSNRSSPRKESRSRDRDRGRRSLRDYKDEKYNRYPELPRSKRRSRKEESEHHSYRKRYHRNPSSSGSYRYKGGSSRSDSLNGRRRKYSNSPRTPTSYTSSSSSSLSSGIHKRRSHSFSEHGGNRDHKDRSLRSRINNSPNSSTSSHYSLSPGKKRVKSSNKNYRLVKDEENVSDGGVVIDTAGSSLSSSSKQKFHQVTEYERNKRTIFVSQLTLTITTKDLHRFFEQAGKVHNARIISDRNSRRSKGVGYVEFYEEESVPRALAMSGQILHGQQIVTWKTDAERISNTNQTINQSKTDFLTKRLYVGHLNPSVTEEMLSSLFGSFGSLEFVNVHVDSITGLSNGFAFVKFRNNADCKLAAERLNGYTLNGSSIKVTPTLDRPCQSNYDDSFDDKETEGFTMSSISRMDLMAKLARSKTPFGINNKPKPDTPSSRNVLLKNMFNQQSMSEHNWSEELKDDVKTECSKYGKLLHIGVDETSTNGHVYLKFDTISEAENAQKALNDRYFARSKISASFIPDTAYNLAFPESAYL